jgi:flagellar biosynthesis protein FlhG
MNDDRPLPFARALGQVVPLGAARRRGAAKPLRTIAVTSGKGGVGKTSVCAALAVSLARSGARVLALDGDLGKANLDLVMGVLPGPSLLDAIEGRAAIEDALVDGPEGVTLLPTCSGHYDLANLGERQRHELFTAIDRLEERFDVLLIDTAAGITSNAVTFAAAAREVVVVATPEPTSLADAYAMAKVLSRRFGVPRLHVLANMVASPREGEWVFRKLAGLADRFLDVGTDYLGFVYHDAAVARSISTGRPFPTAEPDCPASRCVAAIAARLGAVERAAHGHGGVELFWHRLLDTPAPGAAPALIAQGAHR